MAFSGNALVPREEDEGDEDADEGNNSLQNAERVVVVLEEDEEAAADPEDEEPLAEVATTATVQGSSASSSSSSSRTRSGRVRGDPPPPPPPALHVTSSPSRGGGTQNDPDTSFTCTICWEPWTSDGIHRICCLPCGHLYGKSCIVKWIRQSRRNIEKCPQCKKNCKLKDIRTLYAPKVAVVDEDLQKEVISLRGENEFLRLQNALLLQEVLQHKNLLMEKEAYCEKQKVACLNHTSLGGPRKRLWECTDQRGECQTQSFMGCHYPVPGREPRCSIVLQEELVLNGARVFDVDASSRMLLVSQKASGMGGMHVLTKMSLLITSDCELIHLPPGTGAVRDLCISPDQTMLNTKYALVASLGKRLSLVSLQSNSIAHTYALPGPAWSCSWGLEHGSNYVYAGLQNGMLLIFDLRQTAQPIESILGLTNTPIHTIHSLAHNGHQALNRGFGTVLSAAAIGPCLWNTSGAGERPFLIPGLESCGVCISLAYCGSTEDMVASFRPKVLSSSNEVTCTQPLASPSPSPLDSRLAKAGSHFLIKRTNGGSYQKHGILSGNVSATRMPKSAIIPLEDNNAFFAYGDELSNGVCLWDFESLGIINTLKPHQNPILDVKYTKSSGPGLLGCVSENTMQVFTCSAS